MERKKTPSISLATKMMEAFCIKLPKISGYVDSLKEHEYTSFLIKNNQLVKNILLVATFWEQNLIANQSMTENT